LVVIGSLIVCGPLLYWCRRKRKIKEHEYFVNKVTADVLNASFNSPGLDAMEPDKDAFQYMQL